MNIEELLTDAVIRSLAKTSLKTPAAPPEVLSTKEAAKFLGIHEKVVHRYVRERGLPAFRIGRLYRFKRSELLAWLDQQRANRV